MSEWLAGFVLFSILVVLSSMCGAGVATDDWASEQPPAGFGGGVDPAIGAGGPVGPVSSAADWDSAPAPAGAG